MDRYRFDRWAAFAGATPKDPARNQDRAALIRMSTNGDAPVDCGVVVCDGVGSLAGSGLVAERAATTAAAYVSDHGVRQGIAGSPDDLLGTHHCAQHVADAIGQVEDGATTLLAVGADELGFVAYTYVGNGALLDIEPVTRGTARMRLSIAELVAPHITWANGKPDLRAVIPAPAGVPVTAARGVLYPQPDRTRILLAVTDGIASDEDRTTGTSKGTTWRKVPDPLAAIVDAIESGWEDVVGDEDPGRRLGSVLQERLDQLAENVLTDDATVGALLIAPAHMDEERDGA